VTEETWRELLERATALENETFNYSLFTEACTDLVTEFYEATGHPGAFGDLFAPEESSGSLVWMRVPVTLDAADPAVPPYVPVAPPGTTTPAPAEEAMMLEDALSDAITVALPPPNPGVRLSFGETEAEAPPEEAPPAPDLAFVLRDAVPLTFGDLLAAETPLAVPVDTFVFGTPIAEPAAPPPEEPLSAVVEPDAPPPPPPVAEPIPPAPVAPPPEPAPVPVPADPAPIVAVPDPIAVNEDDDDDHDPWEPELSFGPSIAAEDTLDDDFVFSSGTDLSFGIEDDPVDLVAAMPSDPGMYSLGEPAPDPGAEDKFAWVDDFWPF
jgi:hypothetical protein